MVPRREALIGLALAAVTLSGASARIRTAQTAQQDERAPQGVDAGLPPFHERIGRPAREACGGCHERELQEWAGSLHARAWTNPNIRAATDNFRKTECRACHSPMPVLETGLDQPPDYRDFNQSEGVHCLACHGLADGVASSRAPSGAPCRPRLEPRIATAELCWPCHEPTHHAFQEYRASEAFASGKRCQDCHMPPRAEGGGHFHGGHGGFDEDFVRKALEWEANLVEGEVVLVLQNRTGHKFPGEISSRSFLIRVSFPGHEPVLLQLRKPHRGEAREDDRLGPDERRTLRFPLPPGTSSARVELRFLPLPLLPPEQGFLLGEWTSAE